MLSTSGIVVLVLRSARSVCTRKRGKAGETSRAPTSPSQRGGLRHGAHNTNRRTEHSIQSHSWNASAEKCERRANGAGLFNFLHAKRREGYESASDRIHI